MLQVELELLITRDGGACNHFTSDNRLLAALNDAREKPKKPKLRLGVSQPTTNHVLFAGEVTYTTDKVQRIVIILFTQRLSVRRREKVAREGFLADKAGKVLRMIALIQGVDSRTFKRNESQHFPAKNCMSTIVMTHLRLVVDIRSISDRKSPSNDLEIDDNCKVKCSRLSDPDANETHQGNRRIHPFLEHAKTSKMYKTLPSKFEIGDECGRRGLGWLT